VNLAFDGKIVMVAAASSGLGFGVADILAAEGANLAISSRNQEKLDSAKARLIEKWPVKVLTSVCNVANGDSIQQWVSATIAQFNRIDGLVINAGGPPPGTVDTLSEAQWEGAYNLTLMSAVRLIREVLPHMRKQQSGSIVTITSSSVKEPIESLLLSNVFRSGVAGLVKSVAREVAHEGIRINNLIPGRFDTDRVREIDTATAARRGVSETSVRQTQESIIPLGRYGTPHEFGKAAAFLLSDAANYITGANLVIDGGKLASM